MSSSSSSDPGRRGVSLRRAAQTRFVANGVDGFRFTVEAHSPAHMPAEIFLYVRRPLDPRTGEEADEFTSVCSAPDLEEYPATAPTGNPPFFRLATIDLVVRSQHEADEAWAVIRRDVGVLVETLDLGDGMRHYLDDRPKDRYGRTQQS